MPYSESLAGRIRAQLQGRRGIEEKKLFGGVGFLLHGNLLVCVWQCSLIARIGPDTYESALREPHVREFDVTGKPMRGWVLVEPDGIDSEAQLADWIERATNFVASLPKK